MTKTTLTVTTEITLDVETAATWFCGLSDEQQADFFINVQRVADETMGGNPYLQWAYMMGHLRTCECSNEATRAMIREWAAHLDDAA